MTAVERLLAAHLSDVRRLIADANSRANAIEATIVKLAKQAIDGAAAEPQPRTKPDGWSPAEIDLIRDEYPSLGAHGCAKLLPHRTPMAIRSRASKLNVQYFSGSGTKRPRLWCEQCNRNVLPTEAFACEAPFCKAGKPALREEMRS